MATAFWNSWELWAKMCFVLACAIIIAIGLGCLKLMYNNWRVHKYSRIAANRNAIRNEMQHSASVRRGRAKEVPFGIRALEQGVMVEGVWDSGANTPVPSVPGSPALSAQRAHKDGAREPQPLAHSTLTRSEITLPAEGLQSSLAPGPGRRGRPTYQPRRASGLRFSNVDQDPDEVGNASTPEPNAHKDGHTDDARSVSWSRSSDEVHPTDAPSASMEDPNSSSWERASPHPRYYDRSPGTWRHSQESNPFLTPTTTRPSIDMRVETPSINNLFPLGGQDPSTAYHSQLLDNAQISYGDGHAQPAKILDVDRPERASQVVRKINSGFEILQPGTLGKSSMEVDSQRKANDQAEKRKPKKLQRKRKMSEFGVQERQSKT